jgi:hypothetical protein
MFALLALLLLLQAPAPPGTVIDHAPASGGQYAGSPSIVILGDGTYVASHDFFGPGSGQKTSAVTRVFRSSDRGRTWTKSAEFPEQFWSNLFEHRGALYLMGCSHEYGRAVIRRSADGGRTWSQPSYLLDGTGYHTAPVPVVEHNGRLWRAMEWHPDGPWGFFEAFLLSAPVKDDLMKPSSWAATPRLAFPEDAARPGEHWLEGNAVIAPQGEVWNVLRVHNVEMAAITRLGKDGRLAFHRLVEFPGGAKKFTIRWDRRTGRYWTLANPAQPEYAMSAANPAGVRNTLVLMSSADLLTWTVRRTVLSHPDPVKHAFQYVDWQFDDEDLVVASRTAWDDAAGGAHNAHDANYLTFHRVEKFRE